MSQRNHRAYVRKHSRRSGAYVLPPDLVLLAFEPLPEESPFFQKALQRADPRVESDLRQWDDDPPYPSSAHVPPGYIDWLVEVMHGRRLRQEIERSKERTLQLAGRSVEGQIRILKREKELVQGHWEALASFLKDYQGGPREVTMAQHLLQWRARAVFQLFCQIERLS